MTVVSKPMVDPWALESSTIASDRRPKITVAEFERLLAAELPICAWLGFTMEAIGWGTARLRQPVRAEFLRPGGIVCGPIPFALVDVVMYALAFSVVGARKLATTTNISIHFLRPLKPVDLIAEGEVIGVDRRFVTCRVSVRAEGETEPACFATGTYSLPPEAG